jgi:hypothetical protein
VSTWNGLSLVQQSSGSVSRFELGSTGLKFAALSKSVRTQISLPVREYTLSDIDEIVKTITFGKPLSDLEKGQLEGLK